MMTYDAGHDGWTVGTPVPYFGDYSMPGTPYEAWSVQINGVRGNADFETYLGASSGYTGTLAMTGTVTGYTNAGGTLTGTWVGTAGTGSPLQITQVFVLDTNASWVKVNVKLKNVSGAPLTGVYYMRHLDPDNDQTTSGSFSTLNTINHQNDYYHRVMVTSAGTAYTTQTLSLSTKDCRAKCFIGTTWPSGTSTSLASYYTGTGGAVYTGSNTGDYAIGMVWNIGTIAAGDSSQLTFAYVYNGLLGIDSALTLPQLYVNGEASDSIDTVTACAFSGDTLFATILNGATADWAGSTWTWAPSTYLTATTGTSSGILASTMTAPVTYTITGTSAVGGCSGKIFRLTVMPPGVTPPPTVHDTSYCVGATPVPLVATGIGTIWWWTVPTGGTGSTTAPTPSTAVAGTYTWYVSQIVSGCSSARVPITVTITSPAPPIAGASNVCVGSSATVTNTTTGGTWVSSNTAIGTVGSSTGIVTGITAGVITITYQVSAGCYVTRPFTVYATPAAITGTAVVCVGSTTTLANTLGGGTWSSTNTAVATISSTGVVTGIAAGTSTISYVTTGGCFATRIVTVNPLPNPVTGILNVCVGLTTTLSSTTPGGIWTSSAPAVASVGIGTGIVTGISAGTAIISYRVAGCNALATVNVIASPPPITGTALTCVGSTTTLTHSSSGGTWSSSNPAVAPIGATTGVVTGLTIGTTAITYSLGAGCVASTIVTVTATPPNMTGSLTVCVGLTTALAHATGGGTWASSTTAIGTVSTTGVVTGVTAGTTTITYTLPSGCYTMSVVTVNPLPAFIVGSYTMCVGATNSMSTTTPGVTWSSSNTSVATVGATTGVVTGIAGGTTNIITTITATGCTRAATVTVNPLPAAIVGGLSVCPGLCTTLTDATAGGTWSISSATIATVSASGVVCGVSAGTATVTYTAGTGCYRTATVTVNIPPATIGGPTAVCFGYTITMTNTTGGGTWSSSNATIASVGSLTGVV
ncbi:MAG: Ig-like domain-containing protein, partial [Bacteroidota bacterium]